MPRAFSIQNLRRKGKVHYVDKIVWGGGGGELPGGFMVGRAAGGELRMVGWFEFEGISLYLCATHVLITHKYTQN